METIWNSERPGILIEDKYGKSFVYSTIRALDKINSKMVGKRLLYLLSIRNQGIGTQQGNKVVVHLGQGTLAHNDGSMGKTSQSSVGTGTEERRSTASGSRFKLPGSGMGSKIFYSPYIEHQYTQAIGINTPVFVALAHELIHALHVISGDVLKEYDWNNGTTNSSSGAIIEEARTVGCGTYKNTRISENAVRKEHGLRLRSYYNTPGDCDNILSGRKRRTSGTGGIPISYQQWLQKTSRKAHWRSKDLKVVDNSFQLYSTRNNNQNLQAFKRSFKLWYRRNPKEVAKRNTDNCIEKMRGFLLSV